MYEGAGTSLKALSTIYGILFTVIGSLVIVFWAPSWNVFHRGKGFYICVSTIYQLGDPSKQTDKAERDILFWISIRFRASVMIPILLVGSFVWLGLYPVNLLAPKSYTGGLLEKLIFVMSLLFEIVHFQYAVFLGWYALTVLQLQQPYRFYRRHFARLDYFVLPERRAASAELVILTKIYRIQRQWRVVQPLLDDALWTILPFLLGLGESILVISNYATINIWLRLDSHSV